MSMKILSPAGDMESLKTAIYNGADEVYLGVKDFNARNIEGFSLETLKQAVEFAHIFDVKVNLTVNILFDDEEIQSALDLIVDAYNLGVDSFIIQDLGLANLVHVNYPQIEMHASTQMGIHNLEGVKIAESLGFSRVVLSRETPLEEIKRIKDNSSVEIEYFVHGALCVSFSGNCYLSSYEFGASGNRGKCKQLCRLPYVFKCDNKEIKSGYLLSAKDFNMIEHLNELKDAGVDVLKIEGRARRPYYVGIATRSYKQALNGEKYNLADLELGFNRGVTAGYFNGNGDVISNRQNHIGIFVGEVTKFNKGKRFNEIYLKSNRDLTVKSTFKFVYNDEEITLTAYDLSNNGKEYRITTTHTVEEKSKVYLIADYNLEQEMKSFVRKRKINLTIVAKENEAIKATFMLGGKSYEVYGEACQTAKNQALKLEDLCVNFSKNEIFEPEINADLGNVFLTKKQLNEFRRNVYDTIVEILKVNNREKLTKITIDELAKVEEFKDYQFVEDVNAKFTAKNIVLAPQEYSLKLVDEFIKKCKVENKQPLLNLPNFALKEDVENLAEIVKKTKIKIVVNNVYALNFNAEKIAGGGLNVYNNFTATLLNMPYLKAEGGDFKMPYMIMRHCPMKQHLNANCAKCPYREGYTYTMQNGKTLKLKRIKMSSCTFYLTD